MFDPSMLTWTCHVCSDERPDSKISVSVNKRKIGDVPITENVRYCNDRQECVEAAKGVRILTMASDLTQEEYDAMMESGGPHDSI